MSWYDNPWYYAPAKPREVKGGIKSQTKRGDIGTQWWSKRWINTLEQMGRSNYSYENSRLTRGRTYARKGQVMDINIEKGKVTAKVQGTRSTPYKITIKISLISTEKWLQIAVLLSEKIYYAAKLLSGQMPPDIEDVFDEAGESLFPQESEDIKSSCSCPDWSNPCKHIAAVFYLLAEEFDRDPFLIFKLRGFDKEELMYLIDKVVYSKTLDKYYFKLDRKELMSLIKDIQEGKKRGKQKKSNRKTGKTKTIKDKITDVKQKDPSENKKKQQPEPLSTDTDIFWKGASDTRASVTENKDNYFTETGTPCKTEINKPIDASFSKRLGNFPFWRGNEPFLKSMETIYKQTYESLKNLS
jgi:uncharacterized Zn finger protein